MDASALLALLDPDHPRHDDMAQWFDGHSKRGWATCAITENGYLRIITAPRYANPVSIDVAADSLLQTRTAPDHEFWPCDLSLFDRPTYDTDRILGPSQIPDIYLLGLAVAHGGTFVTLDRRISPNSVVGATDRHLSII